MNRTFVVPDDKVDVYEKFKANVPEVSKKLVEFMEEYVNKLEAVSKHMTEQEIYEGIEYQQEDNIFIGKTVRFIGLVLDSRKVDPHYQQVTVFLTKKYKYLVYRIREDEFTPEIHYTRDQIYEDYFEMKANAGLPTSIIEKCEAYLNKNSVTRTYEVLDV